MDHYVIVKNSKEIELERFDEKRLEQALKYFEKGRIIYESPDIHDEHFSKFSEIIWDRYYNSYSHSNAKVIIPFTPDDIEEMNYVSEKLKEEKIKIMIKQIGKDKLKHYEAVMNRINSDEYKLKQQNHREMVAEMDKIIPPDTDEYEAISKWRNLGFPLPPPTIITNLRKSYNKSWNDFIEICNNI